MNISNKFTTDDLLIRIMPGGLLVFVIFVVWVGPNNLILNSGLDFLYTFIFLTISFVAGEVLQTFAHLFEFVIDVFYKGYRPSEIFMYKDNPILKSENIRRELIKKLNIKDEDKKFIEKINYKELSFTFKKKEIKKLSQKYFWKMWPKVENDQAIRRSNINYLFTRVMMIDFFIVFLVLFFNNYQTLSLLSFLLSIVFLWRARGLARGLIFKSVLIFISNNKTYDEISNF